MQVAVERSGRTAGALIVKFKTVDDTAKDRQDFLVETVLQARMEDGTDQASINISTLNAQRNQAVKFGLEIESVRSECVPGDGKFECAGKINSTSRKAVVWIERSAGICGDGIRGLGETCDDGNTIGGDGCSAMCSVETGFSCDYTSGKDICTTPKPSNCGDGIRGLGETCDDGNILSEDGCSETCSVETGFSCDSTSGKDICTTPKRPPPGDVFIVASVMMVGVTADQFVGAKRRIFRQSIADIAGVGVDKVVITSVKSLQNRRAAELEVQFQVQTSQNRAGAIADSLVGAAKDGSLSAKLKQGGLNADVSKMSPPQSVSSDGTQSKLEQPLDRIFIIAIVVPVGLVCICVTVGVALFCNRGGASVDAEEKANPHRNEMASSGDEIQFAVEARAPANLIDNVEDFQVGGVQEITRVTPKAPSTPPDSESALSDLRVCHQIPRVIPKAPNMHSVPDSFDDIDEPLNERPESSID